MRLVTRYTDKAIDGGFYPDHAHVSKRRKAERMDKPAVSITVKRAPRPRVMPAPRGDHDNPLFRKLD